MRRDKRLRVLGVACDNQGCGWYRLLLPMFFMNKTSDIHAVVMSEIMMADMYNYDVIVFQRHFEAKINPLFKAAKNAGAVIVYEMDDDFFSIRPANPAFPLVKQKDKENVKFLMRSSDAVIVSTEPLVNVYKPFNKNIFVCPNMIEVDTAFIAGRDYDFSTINFVYAGGPSHGEDFDEMKPAVQMLLDKYRDKVKFHFMGWCPQPLASDSRIINIPWHHIGDYMRVLSTLSPHVGIVPLHKNVFNISKSNLKFLEYSALGAVTIASDVRPYTNSITTGVNGILTQDNKPETWLAAMSQFVDNPDMIRPMAGNALNTVIDRGLDMKTNYLYWVNTIREIHKLKR